MKNKILIISTIILFISTANKCNNAKEENRDKIIFKNSIKLVEDSIRKMNVLMDKLQPIEGSMINYFFDNEGYFYLNNQRLGKISNINIDTVKMLKEFTSEEKKEFVSLINFLNNNSLTSVFKDNPCKCYLYDYWTVVDKSFSMNRDIYLREEGKNYETLFVERKVLDQKGNLILIGAK